MNTLKLRQENIQNYRFKERMNFRGASVDKKMAFGNNYLTARGASADKRTGLSYDAMVPDSVRQKNGFLENNMSAPEMIKNHYGCAKKSEYTRDMKSPSKSVSFGGLSSNKFLKSPMLKRTLEWANDNSAVASAFSALIATCILRPATIMASPNVEMENRKIASAKSISSGLIGYAFTLVVSDPIVKGWKKFQERAVDSLTDKQYENYTGKKKVTIADLAKDAKGGVDLEKQARELTVKALNDSDAFNFTGRFFKMSPDFLCAIPKAILTIALIPPLLTVLFPSRRQNKVNNIDNKLPQNSVYDKQTELMQIYSQTDLPDTGAVDKYANQKHYILFRQNEATVKNSTKAKQASMTPSFKGGAPKVAKNVFQRAYGKLTDGISVVIEKIVKTEAWTNLADKCKKAGIETHIQAFTGIILAAFYIRNTQKSPKIDEYRKKPLMYNDIITTTFATLGAYGADRFLDKPLNWVEDKFKSANNLTPEHKDFVKLKTGFRVMKSALVFGMMYRWILPWFSTILAEKVWKLKKEDTQNHAPQPQPVASQPIK